MEETRTEVVKFLPPIYTTLSRGGYLSEEMTLLVKMKAMMMIVPVLDSVSFVRRVELIYFNNRGYVQCFSILAPCHR